MNVALNEEHPAGVRFSAYQAPMDVEVLSKAVSSAVSDKRKSVVYAPSANHSPELVGFEQFQPCCWGTRWPLARSFSCWRWIQLSFSLPVNPPHSILTKGSSRYSEDQAYGNAFNAGMMLDEQLDQEMHSAHCLMSCPSILTCISPDAMRNLPTSDDDKFHGSYVNKV